MLHSSTADPFKLALYKLMGKLEPSRRSVPQVTTTTEDWLWFQLAMVDENEDGGLRALAEVLLGYGERHFDGPPNQPGSRRGVWAGVLLMCGQFERVSLLYHYFVTNTNLFIQAVAALWEYQETEVEAVHLALALAYHGLLRVPSRAETSDITPRKCLFLFRLPISNVIDSITFSNFAACSEPLNYCVALRASVRQDGRQGGPAIRVLHTSLLRPGQWDRQRTS